MSPIPRSCVPRTRFTPPLALAGPTARRGIGAVPGLGLLIALLTLTALPSRPARAAWPVNGRALCTAGNDQTDPRACGDGAGGAFVTWNDYRLDPAVPEVFVQHVNASGNIVTGWPASGLSVATQFDAQTQPVLVRDNAGGCIVAWADLRNGDLDIFVQRINAAGTRLWGADGVALCVAPGDQSRPVITPQAGDGAVVAWEDARSGPLDVYLGVVDGTGHVVSPAAGTPVCTASGDQFNLAIAPGTGTCGVAYIAWQDQRAGAGNDDIYVAYPGAGWGVADGVAVCTAAGVQAHPAISSGPPSLFCAGGFAIVSWDDARNPPTGTDIYAQRINGNGTFEPVWLWPAGGRVLGGANGPQVRPVMPDRFISGTYVAWEDYRSGEGDIYLQRLYDDGALGAGWPTGGLGVCTAAGDQSGPALVLEGSGGGIGPTSGVVVAWHDARPSATGTYDIYAQRVTSAGFTAYRSNGTSVCTAAGDQLMPALATDWNGTAVVAWQDLRNGLDYDIYALLAPGFSNLNAQVTPVDWSSPVVPRNQAYFGGFLEVTPVLDGNANTTWLAWATDHEGPYSLPTWVSDVVLDETYPLTSYTFPDPSPPGLRTLSNYGPYTVRGGRHSLMGRADPGGFVPESNEGDNTWIGQWVWSPLALNLSTPVLRAGPPPRGTLPLPNSDGFQYTKTPFAWVASLDPISPSDDYDLEVYDDYTGSTSGFSNRIAGSAYPAGHTDFVVGSFTAPQPVVYPAAVSLYPYGGNYLMDVTDSQGRVGPGSAAYRNQVLPTNRLADVYEPYLTAGLTYYFTLVRDSGSDDMAMEVFKSDVGAVFGRGRGNPSQALTAAVDTIVLGPQATGWYPLVVFREGGSPAGGQLVYSLYWDTSTPVDVSGDRERPASLELSEPRPNPAREVARFEFALPQATHVRLEVYDVTGRRMRSLVDATLEPGRHSAAWDGRGDDGSRAGAGIYWARLDAGGRQLGRRLVMLR